MTRKRQEREAAGRDLLPLVANVRTMLRRNYTLMLTRLGFSMTGDRRPEQITDVTDDS